MSETLLRVHNLKKIFPVKASAFSSETLMLKAVDGVSFDIKKGETLGLVGESGCGKTTVGRCVTRLYEPDGGRVFVNANDENLVRTITQMDDEVDSLLERIEELKAEGSRGAKADARNLMAKARSLKSQANNMAADIDILSMDKKTLKENRKNIQMIFQDPFASLNPRMLVKDIIAEGPREFKTHDSREIDKLVGDLLDKVGLPRIAANRYPHEFSGGQRQRICIARALAVNPDLIVCDEPVSALDVSIQAQVINLLISLQEELDLTYVFIAHDLSVVQYVSDRVAVMYLGRMAEISNSKDLYDKPRHPYTKSLLSAVPVADPDHKPSQIVLEGDVPSPVNPPSGCTFHPRCFNKIDFCDKQAPELVTDEKGHGCACHNPIKY